MAHWEQDDAGAWWYHTSKNKPRQRQRGEVRTCEVCSVEFPALPKSLNRCCSRQCSGTIPRDRTRTDRYFQDETGQWWFHLSNGTRTRANERTCEECGATFLYRGTGGRPGQGRYCSQACANKAVKPRRNRRGEDHPNWKGGRHKRKADGYVTVHITDPETRKRIWQLEHRHVMAQHLGRPLRDAETVHHRNGQRDDNRLENLELRVGRHGKGATEAHCPTCTCFAHD